MSLPSLLIIQINQNLFQLVILFHAVIDDGDLSSNDEGGETNSTDVTIPVADLSSRGSGESSLDLMSSYFEDLRPTAPDNGPDANSNNDQEEAETETKKPDDSFFTRLKELVDFLFLTCDMEDVPFEMQDSMYSSDSDQPTQPELINDYTVAMKSILKKIEAEFCE